MQTLAKRSLILVATATLCASFVPSLQAARVSGVRSAAKLQFKLPSTTALGEPVIMVAKLENNSMERMIADFGANDQAMFVFRRTRPDGSVVRAQPPTPRTGGVPGGRHLVARGTEYKVSLVLSDWLDFATVGRYEIDVEFLGSVTDASGEPVTLNRNAHVSVVVKPRK